MYKHHSIYAQNINYNKFNNKLCCVCFDGRPTNLPAHGDNECRYKRCRCGSIGVYPAILEKNGRMQWICGLCHDEIKYYYCKK